MPMRHRISWAFQKKKGKTIYKEKIKREGEKKKIEESNILVGEKQSSLNLQFISRLRKSKYGYIYIKYMERCALE